MASFHTPDNGSNLDSWCGIVLQFGYGLLALVIGMLLLCQIAAYRRCFASRAGRLHKLSRWLHLAELALKLIIALGYVLPLLVACFQ